MAPLPRPSGLAIFLLVSGCTGIAVGVLAVAVPLYALALHASPAEVGLIRAASGAGLLAAALPAGVLVDRFGARRVFHLGSAAMVLAVGSFALARDPAILAVLVFCDGAARALQLNALTTIFYQALPGFGVRRVGWHRGALSLGLSFAGPLLGGALVGGCGFGLSFGGVIALAALPNLLLRRIAIPKPDPAGGASGTLRAHLQHLPAWLATQDVAACLATEALVTGTFCTFSTFIVVLAVADLHLAAATAALLVGIEGAAYIVTVFMAGALMQRMTRRGATLTGIALAAPSLGVLSATPSSALLLAASVSLGLGLGLLNLVATARAATLAAGSGPKGGVASLFMTCSSLGGALGPALAGGVAAWGGTQAAFLALLPLFALLGASAAAPAGLGGLIRRQTNNNLAGTP